LTIGAAQEPHDDTTWPPQPPQPARAAVGTNAIEAAVDADSARSSAEKTKRDMFHPLARDKFPQSCHASEREYGVQAKIEIYLTKHR
jgi:hypothetical protein